MKIFIANPGEYEESILGVFETLEEAKTCVEKSNPQYNTEVEVWETTTQEIVETHDYGWHCNVKAGWTDHKGWRVRK
jgi:hypothetical protein